MKNKIYNSKYIISLLSSVKQILGNNKSVNLSRVIFVWFILISGIFLLTGRLFYLQIAQGKWLTLQARKQQIFNREVFIARKTICDRNGKILAMDTPSYDLFVHPRYFNIPTSEVAEKLGNILGENIASLEQLFLEHSTGIFLRQELMPPIAEKIRSLTIDGIDLTQKAKRHYPYRTLGSELIGYVDHNHTGKAGLELSLDPLLRHVDHSLIKVKHLSSDLIDNIQTNNKIKKKLKNKDIRNVYLTIDIQLQRAVRSILRKFMNLADAKRGMVIVLDSRDGAILSQVTEPTYDPNNYYNYPIERFNNWAINDLIEPGSTFKPLNVAIGLETMAISQDDEFLDEGCIRVGEHIIANNDYDSVGARGSVTPNEILTYSSNVGMIHIIQRISPIIYHAWLHKLGIGRLLATDMPVYNTGWLRNINDFSKYSIEPAAAAFGQGLSMTPLQLATYYGCLANDGKLIHPYTVLGVTDWKNNLYRPCPICPSCRNNQNIDDTQNNKKSNEFNHQLWHPDTCKEVLNMMESVVVEGTGSTAFIPGFRIGGKTGTAQKVSEHGGYLNAKITSFAGIFPLDREVSQDTLAPRYVILAVLDEPSSVSFGSTTAAPIVKEVIEFLINLDKWTRSTNTNNYEVETTGYNNNPVSQIHSIYPTLPRAEQRKITFS